MTATITIAGLQIAIEVLDSTVTRSVSRRVVESQPIPISAWPWSADEIAARVRRIFDNNVVRRPDREDIAWAVGQINDARYLVRAVPTESERRSIRQSARAEAADGLV